MQALRNQQVSLVPKSVLLLLKKAREEGQKIVFVTGVFDILHEEHVFFLQKAKDSGDVLVVGVESDVRVRKIKGEGRPIQKQKDRFAALLELECVDSAFVLPEKFSSPDDHKLLISLINPDILAVSSHTAHLDKKRAIVENFGGRVEVVHQHNPKVSTTIKLEQSS